MTDLRWQDDDEDGFLCLDGETRIGRIRPISKGHPGAGSWRWFAWFAIIPNAGTEHSRRGAMLALEATFERYLQATPNARQMPPYPMRR